MPRKIRLRIHKNGKKAPTLLPFEKFPGFVDCGISEMQQKILWYFTQLVGTPWKVSIQIAYHDFVSPDLMQRRKPFERFVKLCEGYLNYIRRKYGVCVSKTRFIMNESGYQLLVTVARRLGIQIVPALQPQETTEVTPPRKKTKSSAKSGKTKGDKKSKGVAA